MKAALEKRMRAIETASAESCQKLTAEQEKEAQLEQQTAAPEIDASGLRDQAESSPVIVERLREIDCQNKALKGQIEVFQEVSVTVSRPLQERLENYGDMQLRTEVKELDLKQAQDNAIAQAEEQAASVEDALKKHEEE